MPRDARGDGVGVDREQTIAGIGAREREDLVTRDVEGRVGADLAQREARRRDDVADELAPAEQRAREARERHEHLAEQGEAGRDGTQRLGGWRDGRRARDDDCAGCAVDETTRAAAASG